MSSSTSLTDTLSILGQFDVGVVFPDYSHAEVLWPNYVRGAIEKCPKWHSIVTQTAVTFRCTHRIMRYWVPYDRDSYMDSESYRRQFILVSTYYTKGELWRMT